MKKLKILALLFICIFMLSVVLAEESYTSVKDEQTGITTISVNEGVADGTLPAGGTNIYFHAKDNSYAKILDGNVIEANLTASNNTSWTFGAQTINVKEGTRVFYKDGKIEIFGEENQSIGLTDKNSGIELTGNLKLGGDSVFIKDGIISGKNFEVDGIKVAEGSLLLAKGGYILGENSVADWKGLALTNDKELFLATFFDETKNHDNWIFPEDLKLSGKGSDFDIRFKKENPYVLLDYRDNFVVRSIKDTEFSIENRNPQHDADKKIPLMQISGDFVIEEDSKTLSNKGKDIVLDAQKVLYETLVEKSSTTPIELQIKDKNGNLRKEKYIINNFNGLAVVPLDAAEGKTNEKYGNSIYWKRASTETRFNYLTIKDFEDITGKKLVEDTNSLNSPMYAPQVLRRMLDYYQTLPVSTRERITSIYIHSSDSYEKSYGEGEAVYEPLDNSIHFRIDPEINDLISAGFENYYEGSGLEVFRHEVAHLHHDLLSGTSMSRGKNPAYIEKQPLVSEVHKLRSQYGYSRSEIPVEVQSRLDELLAKMTELNKQIPDHFALDSAFTKKWLEINKDIVSFDPLLAAGMGLSSKEEVFKKGFVYPYGANSFEDSVATVASMVVHDPNFFKREGLLEGGKNYNPKFKQEIDLLKDNGFITLQEYEAVFR